EEAHAVVELIQKNDGDVTLFQDEIRTTIRHLQEAIEGLVENVSYDSFKPGEVWLDTNGAPIQAHGGGRMYDEKTETYYWYGEDKAHGYIPGSGVRVYSSQDVCNWEDHGLALTVIESMEQFETDQLIYELYQGREDKAESFNDI